MGTIIPAPGSIPAPEHAAHGGRITLTHADTAPDDRIGGRSGATTWWQDGTTSYVLHFRSGQVHGWTVADETDTAIQALDSLRTGENMSADRLWAALRDVRRLRSRLEALEAELTLYAREKGPQGRPRMALREIGEAAGLHHSTVAERVERAHVGEHAPWRHWLVQGTDRAALYVGDHTPAAVGDDQAERDGASGLDEAACTCSAPAGYGSHDDGCAAYGDLSDTDDATERQ
jgi:hypothetical protein